MRNLVLIILGVGFGILFLVLIGFVAIQFMAVAQGQPMELAAPTSTAVPASLPATCGANGSWTVLTLGRTVHERNEPAPAEYIRLIKADFDNQRVVVYAFPPDLVVATPHLTDRYGLTSSRLGRIFTEVMRAGGDTRETEFEATQATAQAIFDNFGIAADHYLTVKEDVVMELIDVMGGIEVTLPEAFVTPQNSPYGAITLNAGKHILDGRLTHAYMTYRQDVPGEWNRMYRHDVILAGLLNKVKSGDVLEDVPELYDQFKEAIISDLSVGEFVALSCLSVDIPAQNIIMDGVSSESVSFLSDGSVWAKDYQAARLEVLSLFSGE